MMEPEELLPPQPRDRPDRRCSNRLPIRASGKASAELSRPLQGPGGAARLEDGGTRHRRAAAAAASPQSRLTPSEARGWEAREGGVETPRAVLRAPEASTAPFLSAQHGDWGGRGGRWRSGSRRRVRDLSHPAPPLPPPPQPNLLSARASGAAQGEPGREPAAPPAAGVRACVRARARARLRQRLPGPASCPRSSRAAESKAGRTEEGAGRRKGRYVVGGQRGKMEHLRHLRGGPMGRGRGQAGSRARWRRESARGRGGVESGALRRPCRVWQGAAWGREVEKRRERKMEPAEAGPGRRRNDPGGVRLGPDTLEIMQLKST
nr:translation initiation factor IF-2-like [Oryctolagus cuniculus]